MEEWTRSIGTLSDHVLASLSKMLDNSTCGWRQLADAMSEHPKFRCSERELTSCSVQVLRAVGSPGRTLLARLADRSCSLDFLLHCLKKIDHREAVQYLTTTVAEMIWITTQPQSQQVAVGERVILTCRATGPPALSYQWFRGKEEILDETGSTPELLLCPLSSVHQGHYICRVSHGENYIFSQWARVHVVHSPSSSPGPSSATEVDHGLGHRSTHTLGLGLQEEKVSQSPPARFFFATDKVALLIGNMSYAYHTQLCAPIADVHELTNLLRQMDFKVVSLLDLNWQEMHSAVTEFLMLLDKGVYGLLYFAGHGYENYGNSFMVPIDAPASYTSEHCLCVQNILTRMQEKETGLNVFLLDMCRKRNPNDDVIVQTGLLKVTANIVFGYATCADAEAYEVKKEDVSNGIFISFLKRRVCEDEKVTQMLDKVAEDMGRCEITQGRQALELRSNLSERRSLTDQVQTTKCSASYSARNLQWAIAHVLPKSQCLQFDCGVTVQLGFAAEFSNVMVIYTRILYKPKEIVSCSAQLTDFPEDVDIDLKKSNQETLLEAGSLLLIEESLPSTKVPSLYTRISSLQRLRRELTFTVCLHYTYSNMDDEVEERQPVTVGKPLVSKLNFYEPRTPQDFSFSLNSFNVPECSSNAESFTPVGSASNKWSCYSQTGRDSSTADSWTSSKTANIPEENDSPELFDSPQPLVASKSLPHSQVNDTNYKFSDVYNFQTQ
uniref:MALT paracaspase 2 n=1 Tax=Monopterus albus TaxID=43700 RepID=A0A3Q3K8B4_MONAL|nr:mucosa-associated lymphoid tissue lymphoma translocation protein 1-like [Monopterus albus]XP_020462772.1 mucosa-associated lymphoid tissue lymphoma translocation protein 1-like [Monopterus albus]